MNKVILTGNLVRDIELRATQNGTSVISSCIAVSRDFKNPDGTYTTDFINFVAWDKQADYLSKYAMKGDKLEIVGRWQVRQYTDRNGTTQTANEVVVEYISCSPSESNKNKKFEEDLADIDPTNEKKFDDDLPF